MSLSFKIILLGNSSVGKTSIVNRFIGDRFQTDYKATIGPDYQFKLLQMQGNEVRLEIWDLVGMDTSYKGLNRNFCREAQGVIMVADISSLQSIEDTSNWKQEVDEIISVGGSPIPIVLCINKVDKLDGMNDADLDYL
jgi:small GTP-binding protein